MTQQCKMVAKYGSGRKPNLDDMIAMQWTTDDHSPYSKNPGAYKSAKAFIEVTTCPDNNWVELHVVEIMDSGKGPRSRTIHVTLEKQFADMLANHILHGKFKQEG